MAVLRYFGYSAFFLLWVVLGLYWTFPWDVAKDNLQLVAREKTGLVVKAKSLRPSWGTGVVLTDVTTTLPKVKEPVSIERIEVHARLLPLFRGALGATVESSIFGGKVDLSGSRSSKLMELEGTIRDIQLELVAPLREKGWLLSGKLGLTSDLRVGVADLKLSEGTLVLEGQDLVLEKGAELPIRTMLGPTLKLPIEIGLGSPRIPVTVTEGVARLDKVAIAGRDLEVELDGTITLMSPPGRSTLDLRLGVKPTAELMNANPVIKSLLNNPMASSARDKEGFFRFEASGSFDAPQFKPAKR